MEQVSCDEYLAGKTLRDLNWGYHFNVNVIKVVRGRRHLNMPSGNLELRPGDEIFLLGRPEELRSLRLAMNKADTPELPTLRDFINAQKDEPGDVYSYAIPVRRDSSLQGKTIRDSGLRERYDCMILGVQRARLPILQPDVNMSLQAGDRIWVLGARRMAEKLLASELSEES